MEVLSKVEETTFTKILQLQKGNMESKVLFTIAMVAKLVFKDGFIILFLILAPSFFGQLAQQLKQSIPDRSLVLTIILGLLVVMLAVTYLGGDYLSQSVAHVGHQFIPWIDVFAFPMLGVLILVLEIGGSTIEGVICVFIALGVILLQLLYNLVNFSKSPRSSNLHEHRDGKLSLLSNFLLVGFCFFLIYQWTKGPFSRIERIIYSILQMSLTILKLKEQLLQKYYLNNYAQTVANSTYLMEFNLGILAFAEATSQLDLIITNLPFLQFTMTVLASMALTAYLDQRQNQLYLSAAAEMKSEDEALLYLDCLGELSRKVENEEDDIILISMRKRHQMDCQELHCFCTRVGKELGQFIRAYLLHQLDSLTEQFHNTSSVLLSILYFKIVLFKSYPQILIQITEYKVRFSLPVLQRFQCYWLTDYVSAFIRHRNQQIKAVQSEEMFRLQAMRQQMAVIIRKEVEVRERKWRYLARGLCRVEELDEQCDVALGYIERMVTIYQENKVKFKKSKEFNLLLLFYFLKVSFVNSGGQLRTNLKEIYYGYKVDQLRSLKEFRKFIFHKHSSAIETLIDTKTMGITTNVSSNVQQLFGVAPDKLKGNSINTLMPSFMARQHQTIMQNWVKIGTWRTIGKLKQIFCLHKDHFCFSALIYLKIYVRDGSLHFITNIFQTNDCDYLVLNPTGQVEGMGRKFVKVLGEQAHNIPFNLMVETASPFPSQQEFEPHKVYRRVLMGLRGLQDGVEKYKQASTQLRDVEGEEEKEENFYRWMKENCQTKFFVEFSVQNYKMGGLTFQVLQMHESRSIQKHKTSYFLQKTITGLNSMKEHLGDELEVEMESSRHSDESKEEELEEKDPFENLATSSVASLSEKENYPLTKMVQKFLCLLRSPSKVRDRRISVFTVWTVALLVLVVCLQFVSSYFYQRMFLEVQRVLFADGAVSDIMQTTQIAYAHVYQLRSQLIAGQLSQFDSDLNTAIYINNYVYGLKEFSFAELATQVTQFSRERIYFYLQRPTWWRLRSQQTSIDTYQFLENMQYLTKQMLQQLRVQRAVNSSQLDLSDLDMLANNFRMMESENDRYLVEYEQKAEIAHSWLNYLTIASMVIFGLLLLIQGLLTNSYYRFRFHQTQISFKFVMLVPNQLLERMKEYYSMVKQKVTPPEQLKAIDQHQEQLFMIDSSEPTKVQPGKFSSFSKVKLVNYEKYHIWAAILLILLALNGLNYLATYQIRQIFGPSQSVFQYVNDLMRGQNRLLQAYFDMKANYYLNNRTGLTAQFFEEVRLHMRFSAKEWNTYANDLTSVLKDYDPTFQVNFNRALVNNVCTLSSDVLPSVIRDKCFNELHLNVLDGGIMIAMNFFERNVLEALETLRQQYVGGAQLYNGTDYFQQLDFTQIDKMEIYMFKMYQLTQSVAYESYLSIISNISADYLNFCIVFLLISLLWLGIWLRSIPQQKHRLSRIYARLLLVPFNILKANIRIVNSFKDSIQYADN